MEIVDAALVWASGGVHVHPVRDKAPALGVGWQAESSTDEATIRRWWRASFKTCGLGIQTGIDSGIVVIDVDTKHDQDGMHHWKELCMSVGWTDKTYTEKTPSGGYHYFFKHPGGEVRSSDGKLASGVDVRGDQDQGGGNIVVAPTSGYSIVRNIPMVDMPPALVEACRAASSKTADRSRGDGVSSTLAHLLTRPPSKGEIWTYEQHLFGHLVKLIPYYDACHELVVQLGKTWPDGLHDKWETQLQEIWDTHHTKVTAAATQDATTGWLVGAQGKLYSLDRNNNPLEWANFDVRCKRMAIQDGFTVYTADLVRGYLSDEVPVVLGSNTLGDYRLLNAWLAGYRVNVAPPPGQLPECIKTAEGKRIQRYIESQGPAAAKIVDHLGWSSADKIVVVNNGAIGEAGFTVDSPLILDPRQPNVHYHYGYKPAADLEVIIAQLATFHYEQVVTPLLCWATAAMVRPLIEEAGSALFPIMAMQGPAGSGKTKGFVPAVCELTGWGRENPTRWTTPSLRNVLSENSVGIVRIDDMDDPANFGQLLRAITEGGAITKMAPGNIEIATYVARGSLLIAGESLSEITLSKAQQERIIEVFVPKVSSRPSLLQPGEPQWRDVVAFEHKWGDLREYAGTFLAALLSHRDVISKIAPPAGGDRVAMSEWCLIVGAHLLAEVLGDSSWVERINAWDSARDLVHYDYFIENVLPWAVKQLSKGGKGPDHLALYYHLETQSLRFRVGELVEDYLRVHRHLGARERALLSEAAVRQQLEAAGQSTQSYAETVSGKDAGRGGDGRIKRRYRRLDTTATAYVFRRADMAVPVTESDQATTLFKDE